MGGKRSSRIFLGAIPAKSLLVENSPSLFYNGFRIVGGKRIQDNDFIRDFLYGIHAPSDIMLLIKGNNNNRQGLHRQGLWRFPSILISRLHLPEKPVY